MTLLSPDSLLTPDTLLTVDGVYSNPTPYAWTEAGSTPTPLKARLAFSFVLCKSSGEPVEELLQLKTRQITKQLNLPVSVTIDMNMDDDSYAFALLEQQPRLKVYRPSTVAELAAAPTVVNQLVFYGSLPSEGVKEDAKTGTSTMSYQDPAWVFNNRYVPASVIFAATDQGSILWSIINTQNTRTNGDTWIRQGATTTGVARDRTYDAGKEVAGLIADMTSVDQGCDVAITPLDYWTLDGTRGMGLFNAYSQRGTDRPTVQFVYAATLTDGQDGGLASNVGNITRTRAKTITSATSVGATDTQTYATTTSPFGLLEEFETYSDVSVSQTLIDKSVGKVLNRQNAPMILEITDPTTEAPQPFIDYDVGDTVYVTCRRGGMQFYNLPVRVHGIDITITPDGFISTKLTIATLPGTDFISVTPSPPSTVPGGGGSAPGYERITAPTTSTFGLVASDSTVQYAGANSTRFTPLHFTFDACHGSASGLIVGTTYTARAWVRGNDSIATGTGTIFKLYAGGFGSGTETYGTNDATHIWNATLATRQAWTQISVTFVATATTMDTGIYLAYPGGVDPVYSAAWTITTP